MFKKSIPILIAFCILVESFIPGMDFHELSKLPELIKHYKKHRSEQPEMSFIDFIELHYQNMKHQTEDSKAHHKLPFSSQHTQYTGFQQLVFQMPLLSITPQLTPLRKIEGVIYKEPLVSDLSSSIWQPPKIS